MDETDNGLVVTHALPIVCAHCGETTRLVLTTEQALRLAVGLQSSALGLPGDVTIREGE